MKKRNKVILAIAGIVAIIGGAASSDGTQVHCDHNGRLRRTCTTEKS